MKKTINELLEKSTSANLAVDLDNPLLDEIGQAVQEGFEEDDASLAEWRDDIEGYIDVAMQKTEEKSYPWPDAANIKVPTLTTAANQFHARAYPDIVQSRGMVKGKVTGYDHDGSKEKKAERIAKHMTYQLMDEMEEWEDDMDRGLLVLPVVGCFFKKTYYDPHKARNVSKAVWAQDLVMDYETTNLERAVRKSEVYLLYPQEIEERKRTLMFSDVDIDYQDEENDEPEEFIEQHTFWDLDDDGYKEPYIITIHKETGQVVRIVPRYDEDSIYFMEDDRPISVGQKRRDVIRQNQEIEQQNIQAAAIAQEAQNTTNYAVQPPALNPIPEPKFDDYHVAKIEPIEYYTLFPFLPNPDGSIYSMGFGHLLNSLGEAANTTVNQMLDASTLTNLGGGFISKSAKRPAGNQQAEVGEYVSIETNGMPLRDAVLPFQFRGPSAQSFSLLELLLSLSKDITGLKDISSEIASNTQATTAMIIQEESSRTYSSLYKRVFRSTKDELRKLYRLNAKHLPEESYFNVLDTPEAIKREDYNFDETDVQPVGDPTQASSTQRILRAKSALDVALSAPVGENITVLKRRLYEAMDVQEIDEFMPPDQPQADPKLKLELRILQQEYIQKVADTGKTHSEAILNIAKAESEEVGNQIEIYKAELATLQGEVNGTAEQGGLSSVEEPPGNEVAGQGAGGLPAAA